jgi:hypothetical protein
MNGLWGKYRGTVVENVDPLRMGRLQALVPSVFGEVASGWAMPCVPYVDPPTRYRLLPPVDAAVWIEFEEGDVAQPIWSGCFWGEGEWPAEA